MDEEKEIFRVIVKDDVMEVQFGPQALVDWTHYGVAIAEAVYAVASVFGHSYQEIMDIVYKEVAELKSYGTDPLSDREEK